jgi:hypothetical protein
MTWRILAFFFLFLTTAQVACVPTIDGATTKSPRTGKVSPDAHLDVLEHNINTVFKEAGALNPTLTGEEFTLKVYQYLGGSYHTSFAYGRIFVFPVSGYNSGRRDVFERGFIELAEKFTSTPELTKDKKMFILRKIMQRAFDRRGFLVTESIIPMDTFRHRKAPRWTPSG